MNSKTSKSTQRGTLLLYAGFGLTLLAILIWTTLRSFYESPSREIGLELPGYGWVTLTLSTDPFPPMPGGSVTLDLKVATSRGSVVNLGSGIPYRFGMADNSQSLGEGQAFSDANGYLAQVQFPAPGNYWLVYDLADGYQARFSVYVKPAQ